MSSMLVAFDLDDTLYAERDYVRSAWRDIARRMAQRYPAADYADCLAAMWTGANPFDALISHLLGRGVREVPTAAELVEMYRSHRPDQLPLRPGVAELLEALSARGVTMALITDGRVRTQMAKVQALGLTRYIDPADIVISEAVGSDKNSARNFELIQLAHPGCSRLVYVGDNPAKDFRQPRLLGWTTVAILDPDGSNVHPQPFDTTPADALPHHRVAAPAEIINLLFPDPD